MPLLTTHEALIYLMVITSASDRDMTDVELARIGDVVRSWPVFVDFNQDRLVQVAQACQKALNDKEGLEGVLACVAAALPERLRDTAYAAAFEVAAVDL
ncbi:Tellurite resistance protein TerB, partial [Mesorhizobium sp. M4B.F.Ca.ET.172.01.1.1]|uniref:tellurite resistance TerB family protein n=1 Tax=Mesorhizobium sp. M4B.F.Ca.ET.172.01.1.1 TaxID=2563950 RepID=UPI00109380F9